MLEEAEAYERWIESFQNYWNMISPNLRIEMKLYAPFLYGKEDQGLVNCTNFDSRLSKSFGPGTEERGKKIFSSVK